MSMMHRILMPSMDATMEAGTIVAWRVQEGDRVHTGQVLFELESDKSTFEYESPCDGYVLRILTRSGESVPIRHPVAIIGDQAEEIPADAPPERAIGAQTGRGAENHGDSDHSPVSPLPRSGGIASRDDTLRISPRARKLAEQLGVDPSTVEGTGPHGRIESGDVKRAANSERGKDTLEPLSPVRQRISRVVSRSKREIPHFYLQTMVDVTGLVAHRRQLKDCGDTIALNAFIMKAAAEGLKAEPSLRRAYSPGGYRVFESVTLGLAVDAPGGVAVGVVEQVDQLDLEALSVRVRAVVESARRGSAEHLSTRDRCLTVSNLGMYRADVFLPIIHPGEAAILGIGTVAERPAVVKGHVVPRHTMPAAVCVDHRVADGAAAARFLQAFADYLEGWNRHPT